MRKCRKKLKTAKKWRTKLKTAKKIKKKKIENSGKKWIEKTKSEKIGEKSHKRKQNQVDFNKSKDLPSTKCWEKTISELVSMDCLRNVLISRNPIKFSNKAKLLNSNQSFTLSLLVARARLREISSNSNRSARPMPGNSELFSQNDCHKKSLSLTLNFAATNKKPIPSK